VLNIIVPMFDLVCHSEKLSLEKVRKFILLLNGQQFSQICLNDGKLPAGK